MTPDQDITKRRKAFCDELKVQTDLFTEAIQKVIVETGNGLDRPVVLNAILSALLVMQGECLSMVGDVKERKKMRKAMEAQLGIAIVHAKGRIGPRAMQAGIEEKLQ